MEARNNLSKFDIFSKKKYNTLQFVNFVEIYELISKIEVRHLKTASDRQYLRSRGTFLMRKETPLTPPIEVSKPNFRKIKSK